MYTIQIWKFKTGISIKARQKRCRIISRILVFLRDEKFRYITENIDYYQFLKLWIRNKISLYTFYIDLSEKLIKLNEMISTRVEPARLIGTRRHFTITFIDFRLRSTCALSPNIHKRVIKLWGRCSLIRSSLIGDEKLIRNWKYYLPLARDPLNFNNFILAEDVALSHANVCPNCTSWNGK